MQRKDSHTYQKASQMNNKRYHGIFIYDLSKNGQWRWITSRNHPYLFVKVRWKDVRVHAWAILASPFDVRRW